MYRSDVLKKDTIEWFNEFYVPGMSKSEFPEWVIKDVMEGYRNKKQELNAKG